MNEWNEWQTKNINAIVWRYCGETEKYRALIREYFQRFQYAKEYLIGKHTKRVFPQLMGWKTD